MRSVVIGGEGFIGSHLVNALNEQGDTVKVYDIKSGHDARMVKPLVAALHGADIIFHLAAHADIAQSATNPMIDFDDGTVITARVLESARIAGVRRIMYASSSAVYGDCSDTVTDENFGPLIPTSTYAASKIACEALLASYCNIFNMSGLSFRFANVVGPGQPRGIAYDFTAKIRNNPNRLEILGDGTQSKSYVHVSDIINGMLVAEQCDHSQYGVYNIATEDSLTATEIAQLTCDVNGVNAELSYTGGRNGWPGDVPIVRTSSAKLRTLGWCNKLSSRDAIIDSLESM